MNKIKLEITKRDIEFAMFDYLTKKYPNFQAKVMLIEYNKDAQEGYIEGYLK